MIGPFTSGFPGALEETALMAATQMSVASNAGKHADRETLLKYVKPLLKYLEDCRSTFTNPDDLCFFMHVEKLRVITYTFFQLDLFAHAKKLGISEVKDYFRYLLGVIGKIIQRLRRLVSRLEDGVLPRRDAAKRWSEFFLNLHRALRIYEEKPRFRCDALVA